MDNSQRLLIKKYVDLLIARWRLIAVSLMLSITIGIGYYFTVPKTYQSSAMLSFEQQQINPGKMDPEQGRNRLQESLATLRELVMSRNSLEKVITQQGLYEAARKKLPIEDVIEMMRKDIEIKPSGKGDIFSVGFQGPDPQKVIRVTNALASLFIEENLKYREERATETFKYTQNELANSKKVLDEKEQHMRDYKLRYFNELPEQRQSNLAQLQALMQQKQGLQNSIQELERTKVMLLEQSGIQQRLASLRAANGLSNPGLRQPETNTERLQRLRGHLEELQGKYTASHPEVVRTKEQIAQLEGRVGKGDSGFKPSSGGGGRSAMEASLEGQRVQMQIKQIDTNIDQLREQHAKIPPQIDKYQAWIDAVPSREAEWTGLTRDYTELRRHYDHLVAQNLQAQSVENLERSQKGSKFKVVDSARLPEKPFKPNFMKMLLVAVGFGLGLSLGTIILLDFVDTSFKDVAEMEDFIGVPVICAIPFIEKEAETRKEKRLYRISVAIIALYGVILLATIMVMGLKGLIIF